MADQRGDQAGDSEGCSDEYRANGAQEIQGWMKREGLIPSKCKCVCFPTTRIEVHRTPGTTNVLIAALLGNN